MKKRSIKNNTKVTCCNGFTFVEVVAAIMLLSIMISTVLVVMNRYVGAVADMKLRQEAFELARSNMESLLSESRLPDIYDYGESETNPAIEWKTVVEPFTEPYKNRMWIRAVCSASFIDSKGEEQNVELEHWITNLTAAQIRQILNQQEIEENFMDLLQEGQYTDMQMTTIAYLEQKGKDVEGYKALLGDHRRRKVEYLDRNGTEKYDEFVEELADEENEFLESQGMDFDDYNTFAASYVPPTAQNTGDSPDEGDSVSDPDTDTPQNQQADPDAWVPDWDTIPKELWPLIEQLTGNKAPSK